MKQFREYKNVFFIGIGGIGMSALARFFYTSGYAVAGYDRVAGPVTEALSSEGIEVVFEEEVSRIPLIFKNSENTLVIYTPAVPAVHKQMCWFNDNEFTVLKRSRVLGMITEDMQSICVAGTHGKTTVSTMTAFLFHNSHVGVNAFLGGISSNFGTNFIGNSNSEIVVVEADEFDRSFWQLTPSTALITSMDADHLDVYGTSSQVTEGFWGFIDQIKKNGKLLIKAGLPLREKLDTDLNIYTYSATANADYQVCNLKKHNGLYSFDLNTPDGTLVGFKLGVPGLVNVENAAAALALCLMNGVPCEALKKALPMFSGIARRFEVKISSPQLVYIDDYAHHPEEIRATLKSVRDAYSGRKITGVFQPHLFSRTRDFAEAFANALNESLDQIVLLPVYPAREEPVSGVSSENITQYLPTSKCMLIEKNDLINRLNELSPDVLITMGAGDIDRLVPDICQWGLNRGTMQNG